MGFDYHERPINTPMKPLAIFDLDGTIRDTYRYKYPRAHQVRLFPGIPERIVLVKQLGFVPIGVTNQGGVSKREITNDEVGKANARTQELLGQGSLDTIYYCPHYADTDGRLCDCKKPSPGLVLDALDESSDRTLDGSFVVGDDPDKDGELARCLALPFLDAVRFRSTAIEDLLHLIQSIQQPAQFCVPASDKVAGTLVGLAVGDALGAPLEFRSRDEVRRQYPDGLREMITSGVWEKGEFTDDTDMALMVALAFCDLKYLFLTLQAYFRRWAMKPGLRLPDAPVLPRKDIGRSTKAAIEMGADAKAARSYYAAHPNGAAGNGALMRCAPVSLFHLNSMPMLIADSRRTALMTHADPKAQSACVILNVWLQEILTKGIKDARELALTFVPANERSPWHRLLNIEERPESEISSSGYTVSTMEAAAWSFLRTETFEEAVVCAANLGDDADTVAAVTGALAGAYYGWRAIPEGWRETVKAGAFIRALALELTLCGLKHSADEGTAPYGVAASAG